MLNCRMMWRRFLNDFVCVKVKRPSQQFFSYVGTEPLLSGYNQYFSEVKCLAQGHNKAEVGFEPPNLSLQRLMFYH